MRNYHSAPVTVSWFNEVITGAVRMVAGRAASSAWTPRW